MNLVMTAAVSIPTALTNNTCTLFILCSGLQTEYDVVLHVYETGKRPHPEIVLPTSSLFHLIMKWDILYLSY